MLIIIIIIFFYKSVGAYFLDHPVYAARYI